MRMRAVAIAEVLPQVRGRHGIAARFADQNTIVGEVFEQIYAILLRLISCECAPLIGSWCGQRVTEDHYAFPVPLTSGREGETRSVYCPLRDSRLASGTGPASQRGSGRELMDEGENLMGVDSNKL